MELVVTRRTACGNSIVKALASFPNAVECIKAIAEDIQNKNSEKYPSSTEPIPQN